MSNTSPVYNNELNLLVVKSIKNSSMSRANSTRLPKNESNNRLFYNFNNQNCSLISNHHHHNHQNFYEDLPRPCFVSPTQQQQQIHTQQPVPVSRLTKIDLNATNNSVSVPSTPSHTRKMSSIDSTKSKQASTKTTLKENKKTHKESILNKIFFHRSKSNSKNYQLDELSISEATTTASRSSSTSSRVINSKSCFPTSANNTSHNNNNNTTSSGYDSPSFNEFDKSSAKGTFNNSIIGGADLLSSGYESLTKENNITNHNSNDDSSDCITTASSLSGDLKFSTLSRLKSGKS